MWTFVGCEGFFQLRKQGKERDASSVSHQESERRGERYLRYTERKLLNTAYRSDKLGHYSHSNTLKRIKKALVFPYDMYF